MAIAREIPSRQKLSSGNNQNKEVDNLLTVHEVARLLRVRPETVRRWSNEGLLASFRLGTRGDRRFKRSDIMSDLLTIEEVAKLLAVHPNTVRRWSDRGVLTSYRLGPRGDRRFSRAEIMDTLSLNI